MGCASPVGLLVLAACCSWLRVEGVNPSLATAVTSTNAVSPFSPPEDDSTPSISPPAIARSSFNLSLMKHNYSSSAPKYTSPPSTSPTFPPSATPSSPSSATPSSPPSATPSSPLSAPPTFSPSTTPSSPSSSSPTFYSSPTSSFSSPTATLFLNTDDHMSFAPYPYPSLPPDTAPSFLSATTPSLPPDNTPSLPPTNTPSLPPANTPFFPPATTSLLFQPTVFPFPSTFSQTSFIEISRPYRDVSDEAPSTAVLPCFQSSSPPTVMKPPTFTEEGKKINFTWDRNHEEERYDVRVTCTRSHDCCGECEEYHTTTDDSHFILESEPGTNYTVRVRAACNSNQTEQGWIEYEDITYLTDEESIWHLNVTRSQKNLLLEWEAPCPYRGDLFDYISLDGERKDVDKCSGNETLTGLKPFTNYTVQVFCKGKETPCSSRQYTTLPDVPSSPRNLNATNPAFNNCTKQSRISDISWEPPKDLNGELKQYTLTYSANGNSGNIIVPVENCTLDKCTHHLELKPEQVYSFSVGAENKAPEGMKSEEVTINHTTKAGTPCFTTNEPLSYEKNTVTQNSITLLFNLTSISNENGKIRSWEVWMQDNDCEKMEIDGNVKIHKVFCTTSVNHSYPNISIVIESKTTKPDSDCPQYEKDHTLIPGECYIFAAVINTTANYSRSHIIRIQVKESYVLFVCLTLLGVVSMMLLVLLSAYVIYTHHSKYLYLHWAFHRGRAESINLPLVVSPPADVNVERCILLSDLSATLENLFSRGHIAMSREYADLKSVSPSKPCWNAHLPLNRPKTRYFNILPFDETRVVLKEYQNDPCSDFINASYIHGYSVAREFIACQGPLENTMNDFWRMVWEKNVHVIVMVTQCIEKNMVKCSKYWPDAEESLSFEKNLKVKNLQEREQHQDGFVWRKLQLSKKHTIRFVHHFHFTSWPDMGCPATPDQLINFVKTVKTSVPKESSHVVVHCSAGVGRTGTFIGLSNLMEEMHEQSSIDVFHAVYKMRLHRINMVQTEAQYAFLYKCVLKCYLDQTEQSQSWSAIERRLERKDNIPDVVNGALEGTLYANSASENKEEVKPVTDNEVNNEYVKEESSV